MTTNHRLPIAMETGESPAEFDLFLFYASIPSRDRKLSSSYKLYKQLNPASKLPESKWNNLSQIHNWVNRARKLDDYILSQAFVESNPRLELTQSLLEFRDKFQAILNSSVKTRELLNQLLESLIGEYKAGGGADDLLTLKINNLYKLSAIYSQLNSQNKADFDIWGSLLGLNDIAERQALEAVRFNPIASNN